ncbi:MAG: methyltransferase family protein [Planctomycetota bacterium]
MRWILLGVLLAAICISGFFRVRARRGGDVVSRREEGAVMVIARLGLTLPLLIAIGVWLANPRWMEWSSVPLPTWLGWVAIGVLTALLPALVWVFRSIGRNITETTLVKSDHQLVTHGAYALVRHPLYTVGGLLLICISIVTTSWLIGAMTLAALIAIRVVVIPREERSLIENFGDGYRDYRRRTPAVVPRFKSRK